MPKPQKKAAREFKYDRHTRIPTSDDWYPTASDGTVRVSYLLLINGEWRVCVWGDDDFGLERDFPANEKIKAKRIYEKLIGCSILTQEFCKSLGMYNA